MITRDAAEALLFHEAALLDDLRFEEWGALFTEDGEYWIPATIGQDDPYLNVSHIYEDKLLRQVRIERFRDPNAISLQPMVRSSHLVSNICVGEDGVVRSRFVMSQFHRDRQTLFTGGYEHELREEEGKLKIRRKRVNLVNCEAALPDIVTYI